MEKPIGMNRKDLLNGLYKKFDLTDDDVFKSAEYTIIKRCGIEKIQNGANIDITYDLVYASDNNIIIKATGSAPVAPVIGKSLATGKIETFGEASYVNYKQKASEPYYPAAMAEKRALSRCVLKIAGFYELEVFGEDELPEQKPTKPSKGSAAVEGTLRKAIKKIPK